MDGTEYIESNTLIDLRDKLSDCQEQIDEEIQLILDMHFWDLI